VAQRAPSFFTVDLAALSPSGERGRVDRRRAAAAASGLAVFFSVLRRSARPVATKWQTPPMSLPRPSTAQTRST